MGASGAAGGADFGNRVALLDGLAFFYQYLTQMNHGGRDPIAMIQNQGASGVVIIVLDQGHHRIGRSHHHRAGGTGHIDTVMGATRLAVVDPLAAIHATDSAGQRPLEIRQERFAVRIRRSGGFDTCGFATNTFEHCLRGRRHRPLGHPFHTLDVVLTLAQGYQHLLSHLPLLQNQCLFQRRIATETDGKKTVTRGSHRFAGQGHGDSWRHLTAQQCALGALTVQGQ